MVIKKPLEKYLGSFNEHLETKMAFKSPNLRRTTARRCWPNYFKSKTTRRIPSRIIRKSSTYGHSQVLIHKPSKLENIVETFRKKETYNNLSGPKT